ncbi:extracellular catalytic domain type 1 short-chain-length polyhydroxyalkanoate depolymerase [Sphingomonas oryzagri]
MRSLPDTIARLAALRVGPLQSGTSLADRLADLGPFGSNPGTLRAKTYFPSNMPQTGGTLVVVLHGCTQSAAGYDHGSGWSRLADRHGFALLFPEQTRSNNPNLCFNWFSPQDNRRDRGEALSIRQMIATLVDEHDLDPERIFITGLSAGGAMVSVMLASYPEVFAGGAIIAGLPFGTASTIPEAFDRMRGRGGPDEKELVARLHAASGHHGRWPTISVWHGSGDATVNPSNADDIIAQWRGIHDLDRQPGKIEVVDGYPRRVWSDASGRDCIEAYSLTGMGHGVPLDVSGPESVGASGPYMLDVSISSTSHIAAFWGLADRARGLPKRVAAAMHFPGAVREPVPDAPLSSGHSGISRVINDALRAAGLMR